MLSKVYIPLRLSREDAKILEGEAKKEGIGKSVLARILLKKALRERILERAIKEYISGRCSLEFAAEIAGFSLREFISELHSRNIVLKYSLEDLLEDLKMAEKLAEA